MSSFIDVPLSISVLEGELLSCYYMALDFSERWEERFMHCPETFSIRDVAAKQPPW
jgi:hypothetical protein